MIFALGFSFLGAVLFRWLSLGAPDLADFYVAWTGGSDTYFLLGMLKGMVTEGWMPFSLIRSSQFSFPGSFILGDFPSSDGLHLAILYFIAKVSGSLFFAYNSYYILGAGLISAVMSFLLRALKVPVMPSVFGGILFSILPFGYFRFTHLFLATYFQVPLIFWFILPSLKKKRWQIVFVSLIIAFTGVYFAFFACWIALFALLLRALGSYSSKRNFQRMYVEIRELLVETIFLIGGIGLGTLVSVFPNIIYRFNYGKNSEVAQRLWSESVWYSLRPEGFLLPMTSHRFNWLGKIKEGILSQTYFQKRIFVEGFEEYIGFIAIFGIFGLVLQSICRYRSNRVRSLSMFGPIDDKMMLTGVLVFCLMLALPYGVGTWFSRIVTAQIRCYNRISVIIACLGLIAFFYLLKERFSRKPKVLSAVLLGACCIGFFDQLPSGVQVHPQVGETRSDIQFALKIREAVGVNAGVLFLPYLPFPEHPPIVNMQDYSPLKIAIHSDFKSNYPAMRGRHPDLELRPLFYKKVIPDILDVKRYGFVGVVIDRLGYSDRGLDVEAHLRNFSDLVFESNDGRFSFFKIVL